MTRVPKSIKSTRQILAGSNHILQSLYVQTLELGSLEQIVRQFVPEEVSVASFDNHVLTLVAANSAISTRVRYRQRNIISALKRASRGLAVESIKIIVRPVITPEPESGPEPLLQPISPENARQMEESAKYIEDEPLREALIRLSKSAKGTEN